MVAVLIRYSATPPMISIRACAPLNSTLITKIWWIRFSCMGALHSVAVAESTGKIGFRLRSDRRCLPLPDPTPGTRWPRAARPRVRAHARRAVAFVAFRDLDLRPEHSYLQLIPIHRYPGGAFVRASVFRLETGPKRRDGRGVSVGFSLCNFHACGAEEG